MDLLLHYLRHIQLDSKEEAYFLSLIQYKTIRKKRIAAAARQRLKNGELSAHFQ